MAPALIPDVLEQTSTPLSAAAALRAKVDGVWRTTTWGEYRDLVRRAARALMGLGLEPGQCVAIMGGNRPQWFIADLAAICAGAIPAGIYATSTGEQSRFIIDHCGAYIVFVDTAEQLAKLEIVRDRLPRLRWIVLMEGSSPKPWVLSWGDFLARGSADHDAALDARRAAMRPDDVCTLIYTSGTTGDPKGVMLTHRNITWTARAIGETAGLSADDQLISYLPLSHIAEQITSLFAALTFGCCTAFSARMEDVGDALHDVRPHRFLGVPRVWEKMQERMEAAGAAAPPFRRRLVRWARGVGLAGGYASQEGRRRPLMYGVAQALVFSKVRDRLGLDRARMLISSAAPISRHTLEFFLSLGLPICEVYGMSECSGPATIALPTRYRTGKAGFAIPGTELRIAADGEIQMRGPHVFAGYYKDADATAAALDEDGWLHSGDIGEIDADGFLSVTDRKKEIIITAGGENIAPQFIEGQLKRIPVVSDAVVIGDRRRYLAALLILDPAKVPAIAAAAGCPATDPASASTCEQFRAYLQREVDGVNGRLARVQTIKRFAIMPGALTVDGGELTPTLKLRRAVIARKHAELIETLYA